MVQLLITSALCHTVKYMTTSDSAATEVCVEMTYFTWCFKDNRNSRRSENCCQHWPSPSQIVRLPIRHNWTFSLALTVYALQGKTCQNSLLFGVGESDWAKISGGRGRPSRIFLVSRELDTFCNLTVQTAPCYVQSFWHNTGVWQTDRQTDGIAVASTALEMRALRRVVKKWNPWTVTYKTVRMTYKIKCFVEISTRYSYIETTCSLRQSLVL